MKKRQILRRFLASLIKWEQCSSPWRLVTAFILGMVLTAAAAQTVVLAQEYTHHQVIAPAPQNAPRPDKQGVYPEKTPAEHQINELVYASSEGALISG